MGSSTLSASLAEIPPEQTVVIDGVPFSGACIVKLYVNGKDLMCSEAFDGGLVVYEELQKSRSKDGDFLLFTAASGIADAGGWDTVKVTHVAGETVWLLCRDDEDISFCFETGEYRQVLATLGEEVQMAKTRGLQLEPRHVVFPE